MNNSVFISKIKIGNYRILKDTLIDLNSTTKKNIIFTGKNGSGKTSLMKAIDENIVSSRNGGKLPDFIELDIVNKEKINENFIYLYLKADRKLIFREDTSTSNLDYSAFSKYMSSLIIGWLKDSAANNISQLSIFKSEFETLVGRLFDMRRVEFSIENDLSVSVTVDNIESKLNELPDGYKSILTIIGAILVNYQTQDYDFNSFKEINGIVMIDEIENHLHAEIQKSIIQILTETFPNIQFILSTHSPIVLSATEDILVYDISTKCMREDLIEFSIDKIVKLYFNVEISYAVIWAKYTRLKELYQRVNEEGSFELYRDDMKFLHEELINTQNKLTPKLQNKVLELIQKVNNMMEEKNV